VPTPAKRRSVKKLNKYKGILSEKIPVLYALL
jgi:hypothetical protein